MEFSTATTTLLARVQRADSTRRRRIPPAALVAPAGDAGRAVVTAARACRSAHWPGAGAGIGGLAAVATAEHVALGAVMIAGPTRRRRAR